MRSRAPSDPRQRVLRLAAVFALLLIAVGVGAAVATRPAAAPSATEKAGKALRQLSGVSQRNISLGNADARAKLSVYADIVNGSFMAFDRDVLPTLIQRYVRQGRLLIQLRTVPASDLEGGAVSDSERAARAAQSAGLQDRLWDFVGVLAARYSGYLDPGAVRNMFRAIPGLDVPRATAGAANRRIIHAIERTRARAELIGIRSMPAFVLDLRGDPGPRRIDVPRMDPRSFIRAIEAALGRRAASS